MPHATSQELYVTPFAQEEGKKANVSIGISRIRSSLVDCTHQVRSNSHGCRARKPRRRNVPNTARSTLPAQPDCAKESTKSRSSQAIRTHSAFRSRGQISTWIRRRKGVEISWIPGCWYSHIPFYLSLEFGRLQPSNIVTRTYRSMESPTQAA